MKKNICILAALILVFAMSTTAFAHGGHGRNTTGNAQQASYALCTKAGCTVFGPHEHNGVFYCSQSYQTKNYAACTVKGCTELGLHKHDGKYYQCAAYGSGVGQGQGCGGRWNR